MGAILGILMLGKGVGTYVAMALTIIGQAMSLLGATEVGEPLRNLGMGLGTYTTIRAGVAGTGKA